uniref:Tyramine beta-hydroxylase n=1 Tax=Panagrellus redivivus TaxID=6233 RepID=A0A7E4VLN4_PANRE
MMTGKRFVAVFVLLLGAILGFGAAKFVEDASQMQVKLGKLDFHLDWDPDFDQQVVNFAVDFEKPLEASRWLLIGFSDHGFIPKTDFCLYQNGRLLDGYIDNAWNLMFEIHQDCHLILDDMAGAGKIVFQRKFVTCDIRDYAMEVGTTQFLFATGTGNDRNLNLSTVDHLFRYNQLLQYPVERPKIDEAARTLEITAIDAHVPAQETTYWCAIVKLDNSIQERKHHIIQLEPIITKGNEHIVHHMEVYHCVYETDAAEEYNGNCNADDKPKMAHMCSKVIAAWAMGADTLYYPIEAGMPFGGKGFRPLVMVEIHYNNPKKIAGIIDNSGFRFTYTPNLRPFDAGIMELGLIYSDANSIPPRQTDFAISGYCVADCTSKLPPSGIKIFGSQLHAHLTGRKLWTSHYRDGVKIGEINRDNHFSPHWQHIQVLQKQAYVLPGDTLVTTCVYDTRDQNEFVFGGYEIRNEMCVNYVYYYPASEVEVCKSAVANRTLTNWFKYKGIAKTSKLAISEKYAKLAAAGWSDEDTLDLKELYSSAPLNMACLNHGGDLFKGHPTGWQKVARPETFAGVYGKERADYECPSMND